MKSSKKLRKIEFNESNTKNYKKTTLDNGIRVVTETHLESRCVVCGFWAQTGTRDEQSEQMGISHFIEHLVFKGTKKYSTLEIAKSLEYLGGELNAYTSREYTCFHSATLKEDLDVSLDVLSQLFFDATFVIKDFETEKKVILQEIMMSADNTEEFIFDTFFEKAFAGNSLSYPILGTEKSIESITRKQVMDYYKHKYVPNNLIISAAGNVNHDEVVAWANKHLGKKKFHPFNIERKKPKIVRVNEILKRDVEQTHLLLGMPSVSYVSPNRFEGFVVNTMLGGGMTSRLYQEIREKRGLAYSVFSTLNTFTDCGVLNIYAGTEEKELPQIYDIIIKEINKIRQKGLSSKELNIYKTQLKGNLVMAAEDIESRMTSIGVNEMVFGRYRPVESIVSEVEKLTVDRVNEFIEKYLSFENLSSTVIGPIKNAHTIKWYEGLSRQS